MKAKCKRIPINMFSRNPYMIILKVMPQRMYLLIRWEAHKCVIRRLCKVAIGD